MEWKKMKFMEDRVGDEFDGLIVSVTKFGMFVELNDMFIEGLVPLASLTDDHYQYHENTRQIIGAAQPQNLLPWAIPCECWSTASIARSTGYSSPSWKSARSAPSSERSGSCQRSPRVPSWAKRPRPCTSVPQFRRGDAQSKDLLLPRVTGLHSGCTSEFPHGTA